MTIHYENIKLPPARLALALLLIFLASRQVCARTDDRETGDSASVRKVLFLGDSMTGWMAERLNAYGPRNGFEVATVVWDGSTIPKWAASPNLKEIVDGQAPDAIIVSLGMNELFEQNPGQKLQQPMETIIQAFGDTPFLWIGPPSWPGQSQGQEFNDWMEKTLGEKRYFSSFDLDIPRQSKNNPHPSREGIELWMDKVAEWIPLNSELGFHSLIPPEPGKMSRGKTFIYKRMTEKL